jgi:predicted RNA-binding Zn-ribbon protein involved in translation (DUF1610 family)
MPIKGTSKITITLDRTTVAILREKKRGVAWDAFMRSLIRLKSQGARAECMMCGNVLETEDLNKSPKALAEENGWTEIEIKGRGSAIGFACPSCLSKLGTEK